MASGVGAMKRSLRRMLRPGEKQEPQGVVYQGVEDEMDGSKESFKVPGRSAGGRRGPGRGRLFASPSWVRGAVARSPGMGSAAG